MAVYARMGIQTGVDVLKIQDVAEGMAVPILDQIVRVDRDSLTLGLVGEYSSFLVFAKHAEEIYGVTGRNILVELGAVAWRVSRKT